MPSIAESPAAGNLDDDPCFPDGLPLPPGVTVELAGAMVSIFPPGGLRVSLAASITAGDESLDWPDQAGWRFAAGTLGVGGMASLTFLNEGAASRCAARLLRLLRPLPGGAT